ncbi:unnamed protein product [Paramecium pentaurelia]|uniref:Transmembrane protein n=1 Tax=Paramecium pentaurelia TaxID=43138 RepID=A0A8S1SUB2_9CILI|nr:unnamed protein product [Paramecium pentaurelia]
MPISKSQKSNSIYQTGLKKITQKLRMSTILLIYTFIILGFSLAILIICQNIQLSLATDQVQLISEQILSLQNKKALSIQSKDAMYVLKFAFYMITSKMSKLVFLNYWMNTVDLKIVQELQHCNIMQQLNQQIQISSNCYTIFGNFSLQDAQIKPFENMVNLLHTHQYTFDFYIVSQQIYLISIVDNLFTVYYPTKPQNETLEAFQQQWFTNYTQELQTTKQFIPYKISKLFQMTNYNYLLATYSNILFNPKLQITGIASLLINFPKLQDFLYMDKLSLMILDEDGTLVYSKSFIDHQMENKTDYIYNETLTGFNITDWEEIKLSINQTIYPIYKYNSLLKQNVYIKASQLPQTELIALTLSNNTYEQEIASVLNGQIQKVVSWFTNMSLYAILVDVIIVLLTILPLRLLFRSTNLVLDMMIKYLNGKFDYKMKDEVFNHQFLQSNDNSLSKLYETYQKIDKTLNNSQFEKSEQCKIIEAFRFLKNEKIKLIYQKDALYDQEDFIPSQLFHSLIKVHQEDI